MQIQGGIGSSTHVDDHGQRVAKSLLDDMSARIREVYVPLLVEHDFNRQVGVVLNSRVIDLRDGEHALLILTYIFDEECEIPRFPNGTDNLVWQELESEMDKLETAVREEYSQADQEESSAEAEESSLADRLGLFLATTEVAPDGSVYLIKKWVASLGDLKVEVYADHNPPHFHVKSKQKNMDARFHLETLELYSMNYGQIASKDIKKIQAYFRSSPVEHDRLRRMHRSMN